MDGCPGNEFDTWLRKFWDDVDYYYIIENKGECVFSEDKALEQLDLR